MQRRRRIPGLGPAPELTADLPPCLRNWALRLIVWSGKLPRVIRELMDEDIVWELLAIQRPSGLEHAQVQATKRAFETALAESNGRHDELKYPRILAGNLSRMGDAIGLTVVDRRILAFGIMLHTSELFENVAHAVGSLGALAVYRLLAATLDLVEEDVERALASDGILKQCGLLSIDHSDSGSLWCKIELLSKRYAQAMMSEAANPEKLLRDSVTRVADSTLSMGHYVHVADKLAIIRPYLKHAFVQGRSGVNVLLYGPPGTGKTELSRLLAADLGSVAYEVASADGEGDPITGEARLRALRVAQILLRKSKPLIVFDEMEDIFNDNPRERKQAAACKAWLNHALESNPVPTVWITNSTESLDPAVIRRFDMVIEMPVPPRQYRQDLLRGMVEPSLMPDSLLRRMVKHDELSPAVVARAVNVVQAIRDDVPEEQWPVMVETLINGTLLTQRKESLADKQDVLPSVYDLRYVSCDTDLGALVEGLKRQPSARLCLYGAPGTGKTAFGHWVAKALDRPLHVRRVSDIVSMWVGQTESNIASVFKEAQHEGAVLMLDEVDSFLQDRRTSQRHWEVTAVNEMLTQMEMFNGLFMASTNYLESLDAASLRRFDLKISFEPMTERQAKLLLAEYGHQLGLKGRARLPLLELTPGDFAAVARQHRFRPFPSLLAFAEAVVKEQRLRAPDSRGIGFL